MFFSWATRPTYSSSGRSAGDAEVRAKARAVARQVAIRRQPGRDDLRCACVTPYSRSSARIGSDGHHDGIELRCTASA